MRLRSLALLVTLALVAACTNDDEATPAPAPSPATASTATVTLTSTAIATSPPTPTVETRPVTGLFTEPRPTEPDHVRSLDPVPASPFAAWNREDVVLYDTTTMTETNLGPGFVSRGTAFSPDGSRFAWTAGPPEDLSEIWVLDFLTGERELISSGMALWWLNDFTIYGRPDDGADNQRLDIETGIWTDAIGFESNPTSNRLQTDDARHWFLEPTFFSDYPMWQTTYRLHEQAEAHPPLEFDAYMAVLAPDGALFVATVPADARNPIPDGGPHIEAGTTNIFEVDPATGVATYIASAEASAPGWSFDASEGYVAWMDGFCAESELASTMIYDRASGELTELDALLWFKLTPNGQLASGVFGASELIDIETLEYVAVLPEDVADIAWSADYRYAAIGFQFGHGGPCG